MNTTFNKSNNYEELDINDITEKNGFNPNEMISYMKEHGLKYNGEDERDMAKALTKQQYDFYSKSRKNFSPQADIIMEKIKKGHRVTDDERFILLTDQKWIDSHKQSLSQCGELNAIKERISRGKISQSDFIRLIALCGFDDEMKKILYHGFTLRKMFIDEHDKSIDNSGRTM